MGIKAFLVLLGVIMLLMAGIQYVLVPKRFPDNPEHGKKMGSTLALQAASIGALCFFIAIVLQMIGMDLPARVWQRWLYSILLLVFAGLAAFVQISTTRKQRQIVARAKAAGVSLSEEDNKEIEAIAASRTKVLGGFMLMGMVILFSAISAWLG